MHGCWECIIGTMKSKTCIKQLAQVSEDFFIATSHRTTHKLKALTFTQLHEVRVLEATSIKLSCNLWTQLSKSVKIGY